MFTNHTRLRRLVLILTLGACAGIFFIMLNPINAKYLKVAFLLCVLGAWIGGIYFAWARKRLRIVALVLPLLLLIPFALPSREIDAHALCKDYLQRMDHYKGTTYIWGGEGSRGIDCSGLPRRALRDALLAQGFKNLNGDAFRKYLEQWWFDASAKALAEGYRNYAKPLGISGTIEEMSYDNLIPGDMAITTNGVHVIVYLGNDQWIQADPGAAGVIASNGRSDDNAWFSVPVNMHRWQVFHASK